IAEGALVIILYEFLLSTYFPLISKILVSTKSDTNHYLQRLLMIMNYHVELHTDSGKNNLSPRRTGSLKYAEE
ncbi:Protein of unknown function, partial [Cotesia congregata]